MHVLKRFDWQIKSPCSALVLCFEEIYFCKLHDSPSLHALESSHLTVLNPFLAISLQSHISPLNTGQFSVLQMECCSLSEALNLQAPHTHRLSNLVKKPDNRARFKYCQSMRE